MAQVLDWTLQFGRKYQGPLDVDGYFPTLDAAKEYLVKYATSRVWEGQPISIGTGDAVALYIVKKNSEGIWFLEESGGSVKKVGNSTELLAFATTSNIGKLAYLTNGDDNYSSGVYVVTGANDVSKLAQSSATGDVQSDVDTLKGKVGNLETAVSTLEGDVTSIETELGKHLVLDVVAGEDSIVGEDGKVHIDTAYVKDSKSLNPITHKALAEKLALIDEQLEIIPKFNIEVVEELPTTEISRTTIYLVINAKGKDSNLYTEYIWLEKTGEAGHWEKLGEQELDLSGYYTSGEVDNLLEGYVEVEENKSLISADDLAQIGTNKASIESINEVLNGTGEDEDHVPGLVEKVAALESENTITAIESTNETYLTVVSDEVDSRLTKLTPIIGTLKVEEDEVEAEGLATVSNVKNFVQNEINNAFAWVDIEEE